MFFIFCNRKINNQRISDLFLLVRHIIVLAIEIRYTANVSLFCLVSFLCRKEKKKLSLKFKNAAFHYLSISGRLIIVYFLNFKTFLGYYLRSITYKRFPIYLNDLICYKFANYWTYFDCLVASTHVILTILYKKNKFLYRSRFIYL